MAQLAARTRRLTQEERTDLSDRRMIECAVQSIVERGISGTKLTDVGLQAGYSRGLAAMRFGTKAGLLGRVASHVTAKWVTHMRTAIGEKSGLAAVLASIDAQERAIAEIPAEMRALYAIFFQSSDPGAEYRADVARSLTAQRRDLSNWMREAKDAGEIPSAVDPSRIAGQVLNSMIGIIYQWIMDPAAPASEMHRDLKQMLSERYDFPSAQVRRRPSPPSKPRR